MVPVPPGCQRISIQVPRGVFPPRADFPGGAPGSPGAFLPLSHGRTRVWPGLPPAPRGDLSPGPAVPPVWRPPRGRARHRRFREAVRAARAAGNRNSATGNRERGRGGRKGRKGERPGLPGGARSELIGRSGEESGEACK